MSEAYKIGVKISLINHVSAGLLTMSNQITALNGNAKKLEKQLNSIKLLGLAGGAMAGAGFMGLGIVGKMIKPAMEYAHQLNIINMAGWTHKEIAESVGDAWRNTSTVITTTATDNLRTLLDLKNVMGTLGDARMALPVVSRIQAVLAASSEGKVSGNSKELGYSMAKALDMIGAATNRSTFEQQAEMMSKVIIATQGRVTPEMYKSVFQYARQGASSMSNEFKYQILPTLMQEAATSGGGGGGSRGIGPAIASLYRWSNQGYVNKKSLPELTALGMVSSGSALTTTTQGTTVGSMTNAGLASVNSFEWAQKVLFPAMRKRYGAMNQAQMAQHIGELTRGNQLAGWLLGQYASKPENFMRDQQNIIKTMSTADAYKSALSNDPNTAQAALSAQWTNFKTAFMMGVVPILIPALIKLTNLFNGLAAWARNHPGLAQNLSVGFIALFASLAFGGTVLLMSQAFRGLGLALAFTSVGGAAGLMSMARALPMVAGGLAAVSATVLGAATALAAAGYAGYKVGGVINSGVDWAVQKMTGEKGATLGGKIYDWTHPSTQSSKSPIIHNHFHVDGKEIANHMVGGANQTGTTGLNPSHNRMMPGTPALGF